MNAYYMYIYVYIYIFIEHYYNDWNRACPMSKNVLRSQEKGGFADYSYYRHKREIR